MNPSSLPRDVALASLATHADREQQYALFLPPGYDPAARPEQRWPVLFIFDPRGRALESLRLAVDGARRNGWVVISSYQSRSDTDEALTLNAIRALLGEVQQHIAFDPRRLYFAGMSGTAKTLWSVMPSMDGVMAGMIGCGGARPSEYGKFRVAPPDFFGMAGTEDFNHAEMREQDTVLEKSGTPHRLDIFNGRHGWPEDSATFTRAIDWLQLMAMREGRIERSDDFINAEFEATQAWIEAAADALDRRERLDQAIRDFDNLRDTSAWQSASSTLTHDQRLHDIQKRQKRLDAAESRFARDFDGWFTRFTQRFANGQRQDPPSTSDSFRELRIASLQKDADDADWRVADSAKRRLERAFVATSFYLPNAMIALHDHDRAVRSLEIAIRIFPDRAGPHWRLARLQATDKDVNAAFRELHRSRQLGYLDVDDLRDSPDWTSLRSDPRWKTLLTSEDKP
ncbi:MAG: hypothetical protein KDI75_04650 [Xanthomonadales bacterium]|nr:hypothetical protein [Xanthomonadales bacterium]